MTVRVGLAVAVVLALLASGAGAATLNVVGGVLVGASGVNVNGTLYDVEFVEGTCITLYSGCDQNTDFPFSPAGVQDAAQALFDQVFLDGPEGSFDTMPGTVAGCAPETWCDTYIPFSLGIIPTVNMIVMKVHNASPPFTDIAGTKNEFRTVDSLVEPGLNWAVWTLVPEPGLVALLAAGALAVRSSRRRSA